MVIGQKYGGAMGLFAHSDYGDPVVGGNTARYYRTFNNRLIRLGNPNFRVFTGAYEHSFFTEITAQAVLGDAPFACRRTDTPEFV